MPLAEGHPLSALTPRALSREDHVMQLELAFTHSVPVTIRPAVPALTVLSFGGGQDSTAILYRLAYDAAFRAQYAPGRLLVLMSDTGDEHEETYAHVAFVKAFCVQHHIEFCFITKEMGYHSAAWQDLRSFYRRTTTIGSKAYPKTCTDKLKLVPLYRYLESWIGREYGIQTGRKRGLYEFTKRFGKIRVLLGIAADETSRVAKEQSRQKWMRDAIDRAYPLVDLGWDRAACQRYIASVGHAVPVPSNCMLCPFKSEIEVLWLARNRPADFQAWVMLEAAKLAKWQEKGDKNFGVFGRRTLPQVLAQVERTHGHLTDAELEDYRMSHGHCVKSSY